MLPEQVALLVMASQPSPWISGRLRENQNLVKWQGRVRGSSRGAIPGASLRLPYLLSSMLFLLFLKPRLTSPRSSGHTGQIRCSAEATATCCSVMVSFPSRSKLPEHPAWGWSSLTNPTQGPPPQTRLQMLFGDMV